MRRVAGPLAVAYCVSLLLASGCSGKSGSSALIPSDSQPQTPVSTSPGAVRIAPMKRTIPLPTSAMTTSSRRPQGEVEPAGFVQIPGTVTEADASPDGSVWALSDFPAGPDKTIWHYENGAWANISGLAEHLTVGPDNTLYALNSLGSVYAYKDGAWSGLGGGASALAATADGSLDVLSNGAASGGDQGIWQLRSGIWTQLPGSGVTIATSWDPSPHSVAGGFLAPFGMVVANTSGSIYYGNTDGSFVQLPGSSTEVATTASGGLYALGYPANVGGTGLYYLDFTAGNWTPQAGSGVGISSRGNHLYIVSSSNTLYETPVVAISPVSDCGISGAQSRLGAPDPSEARKALAVSTQRRLVPGTLEIVRSVESSVSGMIADTHLGIVKASTSSLGKRLDIVDVGAGNERRAIDLIRRQPGVENVSQARYSHIDSAVGIGPNDPYWNSGATPPFYQASSQGGQWDMHLMCVSRAWGYSQDSGNTFGRVPGVLGDGIKIAVIDTGVDLTHPDLASKVVYSATFVNGPQNVPMHDYIGHGTNVAGIAAASTDNDFGFVGAGFNAQILAYRVFPDPPLGCTGYFCQTNASTSDIALAIEDAITQGARVINISLGSVPAYADYCTSPGGEDAAEGRAVADALAHGIVVVAASGNAPDLGNPILECPAGDSGVIAVGASALTVASGVVTGEHVASYSNYGIDPTTWGVLAPGGDPSGPSDPMSYDWIDNIWTSTEGGSSSAANCAIDAFGLLGNCRAYTAGTSQATAHISGVVALMLGANPALTPAAVSSDLCSTAVNIGGSYGQQGCGRADAYRAVAKALGDTSP